MFRSLLNRLFARQQPTPQLSPLEISQQRAAAEAAYHATLQRTGQPRVAIVKQDINEDLYCCPAGTQGRDIVDSTLLRSGQVALFDEWHADFFILETVDDPECTIWQERATKLNWDTLEFFRSYQDRIPGRDYGQQSLAQPVDSIDWSHYDIVISIDNSVPARVTQRYPQTLWCYYVREVKTPEYFASLERPLPGQDIVFTHHFHPHQNRTTPHTLDCPYHIQRYGSLQHLFGEPIIPDMQRRGTFVDHHTMVALSPAQRTLLQPFGPVASTIHTDGREIVPTSERLARRTLDPDLRERLCNSRYFLCTPGQRRVFGTAIVEAIAAGCLVIGTPSQISCSFVLSEATSANDVVTAVARMRFLDEHPEQLLQELQRQRNLIDWLCCYRPLQQLLERWQNKSGSKQSPQVPK